MNEVYEAIGQARAIIETFANYYNIGVEQLPECLTYQLLKLEKLSFQLNEYCRSGICANIIMEAVNEMDWKIIAEVEGNSDAEEWAVYNTIKNLNEIIKYNEPQQPFKKPEAKPMGLDEKLAFIPQAHREAAKTTFGRLLRDGWIENTPTGFNWIPKPMGRLWYFAAIANEEWGMRYDNGNYDWDGFAKLFGVKNSFFIGWHNKTGYGRLGKGKTTNLPKYSREIEEYF